MLCVTSVSKKYLTFLLVVVVCTLQDAYAWSQEKLRIGFIVLPFQNETTFQGKWPIANDVPRFLSAYLKARYRVPTVSPLVVLNTLTEHNRGPEAVREASTWLRLRDRFQIRYLVTGTLLEFDISQFNVGTPNLGGYEAYRGEVAMRFEIYDLYPPTPRLITGSEVRGEYSDRSLALTLFGKPTARTVEFRDLDKIAFGSEEFNRTVIGQACVELSENFCKDLDAVLPILERLAVGIVSSDSLTTLAGEDTLRLQFRFSTGFVMFIEDDRAFVNLGSEDGVRKGMELIVISSSHASVEPREVGRLEVLEVRGPHLSLAQIRKGKGVVKKRDRVLVRILE